MTASAGQRVHRGRMVHRRRPGHQSDGAGRGCGRTPRAPVRHREATEARQMFTTTSAKAWTVDGAEPDSIGTTAGPPGGALHPRNAAWPPPTPPALWRPSDEMGGEPDRSRRAPDGRGASWRMSEPRRLPRPTAAARWSRARPIAAAEGVEVVPGACPTGARRPPPFWRWSPVRQRWHQIHLTATCKMPIHRRSRPGLSWLPQEASGLPPPQCRERAGLSRRPTRRAPAGEDRLRRSAWSELLQIFLSIWCRSPACRFPAASAGASRSPAPLGRSRDFILLDEPFAGIDPIAVATSSASSVPEGARHRGADHRPQRARDAGHLRPLPTSSATAMCWPRAPDEIVTTRKVRRVYLWAKHSWM